MIISNEFVCNETAEKKLKVKKTAAGQKSEILAKRKWGIKTWKQK